MAFLPIAERELRLASRRKSTHRIRLWTTLAALLASFLFIVIQEFSRRVGGRGALNLGQALFALLTFYVYGLSLLAGVLLAADCISVEKREGTLGILFLTDLKGYDVVFGKLTAVGLNAFYGLVAVLPVLGLPLLMGGVTGGEYWRMSLALVNTLFFALATGILVSAWLRESARAMFTAFAILLLVGVALPLLSAVLYYIHLPLNWWYWTSFSPFNALRFGLELRYPAARHQYWYSLLASHLVAWCMLFLASWTLRNAWQDKPFRRRNFAFARANAGGFGARAVIRDHALRSRLLDLNPIAWLAENCAGISRRAWVIPTAGVAVAALLLTFDQSFVTYAGISYVFLILVFVLKVLVAFQACRVFAEARRSGAWEMILSTPLTAEEIIQGQWLAIRRLFFWPAIALITAQLVLSFLSVSGTSQLTNVSFAKSPGTAPAQLQGLFATRWPLLFFSAASLLYNTARSAGDILAVGWVGMWFGLSAKKPNLAFGLTILFVIIIPKFLLCVPDLLIDLFFVLWARSKLRLELRRAAPPQTLVPLGFPVTGHPPVIR